MQWFRVESDRPCLLLVCLLWQGEETMKSSRPYLLRALYEWIVDNGCTPHVLVASEYPGTRVPAGYA